MKIGKTTLASQFPRNLLCGFEHGWNALSNIKAVDILKWTDFLRVIQQLESSKGRETFDTVSIDTISRAWNMCEDYICDQENVDKIGDIPYGAGYKMLQREFEKQMSKITQLGYGIVIISHPKSRLEKDDNGNEYEVVAPDIPERAKEIVNRLVDVIAYIGNDKEGNRSLYTRSTRSIMAGSRFQYLAPKIPLGYQELVDAISDAIDEAEKNGAVVTNDVDRILVPKEAPKANYKDLVSKIGKIARALNAEDSKGEDTEHMDKYRTITEEYLGKGRLVKDCTAAQGDILELVFDELIKYAQEAGIEIKV